MEDATEMKALDLSELQNQMTNIPVSVTLSSGDDSDELYDSLTFHDHDAGESLLATDKRSLINPEDVASKEKAPLNEGSAVEQELICGYDGLKVIIVSSIVFSVAVTIGMVISIVTGQHQIERHGAVSTDVEVCSDIGGEMLRQGGHAVDAAVAAAFCLGVVHGQYSGLGGGGFLLVGNPVTNTLSGFDFRETAPAASTPDMFATNRGAAQQGGLAVAVPGELLGLEAAWIKYGKLKWAELIEPSIQLADTGFKVTPQLAADIAEADFSMMPSLQSVYENKKENETIQRPALALLLKQIASDGSAALYNGTIAREIADAVASSDGILTAGDLRSYAAQEVLPVASFFNLHQVYSLPAPSSGPEVVAILHAINDLNLTTTSVNASLKYHRVIELAKFVAAVARELGDPRQSPGVANLTAAMLTDGFVADKLSLINDSLTFDPQYYFDGDVFQPLTVSTATALVSVADEHNNLVSLTSSLNSPFGSGLMTDSGIILNSAMDSFNWEDKIPQSPYQVPQANAISPGRRPMSNMAPFLAWNSDNLCMSRYAIGGIDESSVQSAIFNVALNLMSFNYTLTDAVERRNRFFPSLYENLVEVENDLSSSIVQELELLGHNIQVQTSLGVVNVASEVSDSLTAQSDSRRLGAQASVY